MTACIEFFGNIYYMSCAVTSLKIDYILICFFEFELLILTFCQGCSFEIYLSAIFQRSDALIFTYLLDIQQQQLLLLYIIMDLLDMDIPAQVAQDQTSDYKNNNTVSGDDMKNFFQQVKSQSQKQPQLKPQRNVKSQSQPQIKPKRNVWGNPNPNNRSSNKSMDQFFIEPQQENNNKIEFIKQQQPKINITEKKQQNKKRGSLDPPDPQEQQRERAEYYQMINKLNTIQQAIYEGQSDQNFFQAMPAYKAVNSLVTGVKNAPKFIRRKARGIANFFRAPNNRKFDTQEEEQKEKKKEDKKRRDMISKLQDQLAYDQKHTNQLQNTAIMLITQLQASSKNKQSLQLDFQIKKMIRRRYFSVSAIQQQQKHVASKMFYTPSRYLVNMIKIQIGLDPFAVIHKCSLLKHGDLKVAVSRQQDAPNELYRQVEKVTSKIVPWGMFFFDVQKLSQRASFAQGNSTDVTYNMPQHDCVINIKNMIGSLKYKGVIVSPTQMKNRILSQLATQSQVKKAKILYYQFLKKRGFIS